MIILEDIALRRGQKLLFSGASATLQPGQKIALIGGHEAQYTVLPLTPTDRLRGTAYPLLYQFIYWQSVC